MLQQATCCVAPSLCPSCISLLPQPSFRLSPLLPFPLIPHRLILLPSSSPSLHTPASPQQTNLPCPPKTCLTSPLPLLSPFSTAHSPCLTQFLGLPPAYATGSCTSWMGDSGSRGKAKGNCDCSEQMDVKERMWSGGPAGYPGRESTPGGRGRRCSRSLGERGGGEGEDNKGG